MSSQVKERPILFNGEMIRAVLDGKKTQTRRVIKPQPRFLKSLWFWTLSKYNSMGIPESPDKVALAKCPYGKVGDRLWVRETFYSDVTQAQYEDVYGGTGIFYKATEIEPDIFRWKPSIFMPRWASRITLEVVSVRVERVQDGSPDDYKAEGLYQSGWNGCWQVSKTDKKQHRRPMGAFKTLWNSINDKRGFGWDENPFVWVVEFKRVKP